MTKRTFDSNDICESAAGTLGDLTNAVSRLICLVPQWGAADAEIKLPSGENTELKRFLFKAWSK